MIALPADVTFTKYFADRTSVAVRAAYSDEDDYRSIAGGVTIRHATPDQNTTFTLGGGYSADEIFPQIGNVSHVISAPTMRSSGFRRSSRPMTPRS